MAPGLRAVCAGENMDRTTISYDVQGDQKSKTFNVMFALGDQPPKTTACLCLVVPARKPGHDA